LGQARRASGTGDFKLVLYLVVQKVCKYLYIYLSGKYFSTTPTSVKCPQIRSSPASKLRHFKARANISPVSRKHQCVPCINSPTSERLIYNPTHFLRSVIFSSSFILVACRKMVGFGLSSLVTSSPLLRPLIPVNLPKLLGNSG
jgi:hypothetical protein